MAPHRRGRDVLRGRNRGPQWPDRRATRRAWRIWLGEGARWRSGIAHRLPAGPQGARCSSVRGRAGDHVGLLQAGSGLQFRANPLPRRGGANQEQGLRSLRGRFGRRQRVARRQNLSRLRLSGPLRARSAGEDEHPICGRERASARIGRRSELSQARRSGAACFGGEGDGQGWRRFHRRLPRKTGGRGDGSPQGRARALASPSGRHPRRSRPHPPPVPRRGEQGDRRGRGQGARSRCRRPRAQRGCRRS